MGTVFDIQRFCVNDGPGIRSVVFLKGCPLKCLWCHNPESNSRKSQLYCEWTKCTYCGRCTQACNCQVHEIVGKTHKIGFEKCSLCGSCVKSCPNDALGIYGMEKNADQILAEIVKDREYYEASGGGVTISGGEPMYQFEFVLQLARMLKEKGIHVCMETSGFARRQQFVEIAPYIDRFLYDYKATGDELHRNLTGVSSQIILENMRMLIAMGKEVVLRCPIIPGYNLSKEHLETIARISREGVTSVEIIPYHDMGIGKAKKIGLKMYLKEARVPEQKEVDTWIETIQMFHGIHIKQA